MGMKIVIPFKLGGKSRLSSVLSAEERKQLAKFMLLDVLSAIAFFKKQVVILVPRITVELQKLKEYVQFYDAIFKEDPRRLDEAVNSFITEETSIIMADLPLLTPQILRKFFESKGKLVIAPGRKGGTNMLLIRDPRFRVSYHYGSFFKHLRIAEQLRIEATVFDSFYSSVDIDDESDLLELMLHGLGKKSWKYLMEIGFRVDFSQRDPAILRAGSV
jgi:2-phospho-L-lactate guanylyltransferase